MNRRTLIWLDLALVLAISSGCSRHPAQPPQAVPLPVMEGSAPAPEPSQAAIGNGPARSEPVIVEEAPIVVPDFQIWTRIRLRFLNDPMVGRGLRITVRDGEVWLAGTAESGLTSVRAEQIATEAYGVRTVHNEISAPPPTDEEVALGADVPQEILQLEPQFSQGVRNYSSRTIVEPFDVVTRPTGNASGGGELPERDNESAQPAGEMPTPDETAPIGDETVPDRPPTDQPALRPVQVGPSVGPEPAGLEEITGPSMTYLVREGDSLWDIAQSQMGSGHRWQELYEANREVIGDDPMHLRVGQRLTIP